MRGIAEHLLAMASTSWGPVVLVVHSFLESFILPVAHDLFLIAVCLARPKLSFVFALMSTIASVCGIMTGFALGRWGGHWVLARIMKPHVLNAAEEKIRQYDVWAIVFACFTPVPVKVFAWIAGTLEMNPRRLILVAFLARGARFFSVASLMFFFGEPAREWVLKYLDAVMIALLIFFVAGYVAMHIFVKPPNKQESNSS